MENLVQIVGLLPVVLIVGVVVIFIRHGRAVKAKAGKHTSTDKSNES
jgi:hypothetical protein